MMAEAAGKATGRPGICFVTRGPGATWPSLLRTGRCVVLLKPLWTRAAHVMALWSILIPQDTTEPCPHGPDDHGTSPTRLLRAPGPVSKEYGLQEGDSEA